MGDAAAVADDIQALAAALQILVYGHLHVIELHLDAVEEGIIVGGAGGDLIQGVNHLNDAVQQALRQHQAQITRGRLEGGGHQALVNALLVASAAPDQVAEALDDYAAAQHIRQAGDALAVAVAVFKGLGEMLRHQQGEVGILGLHGAVFIAVAVYGYDAVGIFIDHNAVGVHAEGADIVLKLLRAVDDLALIELVGEVGEHNGRKLHPNAQVHTVALGGDLHFLANGLHPLAAAAAHGDNAPVAVHLSGGGGHPIASLRQGRKMLHRGIKVKGHLVLQVVIEILQDHKIDVGAQMTDGGIQQVQLMLDAELLKLRPGGGIELCALTAVAHIDAVHIAHQLQSLILADVLVERAAEIIGDVILPVGKGACAAEAAHNGAALTLDAGLDLVSVDGAVALFQAVACLNDGNAQGSIPLRQLVGRKNAARACADYNDIILHIRSSRCAIGSVQNQSLCLAASAFEASKKAPKALDFSTAEVFFRTPADAFSFHCRSIPALCQAL